MEDNHRLHDEEAMRLITENVEKFGCHIALLEADNYLPGFAYSIGLYKQFGHPELFCMGLTTGLMGNIINAIVARIKEGEIFVPEKLYAGILNGYDVKFVRVSKEFYPHYFGYAGWFHGDFDFPVMQILWPDKDGHFPDEEDFNKDLLFTQPLFDRNTDFMFYESRNLGVYTTQDVLAGAPILHVSHDTEGDWQFHATNNPNIEDGKLVSLEAMVKLDPTLNELYHLQYGWEAARKDVNSEWEYWEAEIEEQEGNDEE